MIDGSMTALTCSLHWSCEGTYIEHKARWNLHLRLHNCFIFYRTLLPLDESEDCTRYFWLLPFRGYCMYFGAAGGQQPCEPSGLYGHPLCRQLSCKWQKQKRMPKRVSLDAPSSVDIFANACWSVCMPLRGTAHFSVLTLDDKFGLVRSQDGETF